MVLLTPIIGQWYKDRSGGVFEVVAVDTNAIDIQFVDGTVDEFDEERWAISSIEEIDSPNDCIVSFDEPGDADLHNSEFVSRNEWVDTLDFMDIEFVDIEDQSGHIRLN